MTDVNLKMFILLGILIQLLCHFLDTCSAKDPEEAPQHLEVLEVIDGHTALLQWQPVPQESVRGHLKGYKIQTWFGNGSSLREVTVPSRTTMTIVNYFEPFSENFVKVLAFNGCYVGPASEIIQFTTSEGRPGPVDSLRATAMGPRALRLIWRKPSKTNGRLLGYRIYYQLVKFKDRKLGPMIKCENAHPNTTSMRLVGLELNTAYRVSISAYTIEGLGTPRSIIVNTGGAWRKASFERRERLAGRCNHEITAADGEVSSPGYPHYYPARKECLWHFKTTPGHRIKLIFKKLEMEPHTKCGYDNITLYDGNNTKANILGRVCGSKVPQPIIASKNEMYMVFKSDASVQRKGFKAHHTTVCGGHLRAKASKKHLHSHAEYGDRNYKHEACDWVIKAKLGYHVQLRFLTFEIEGADLDCVHGYVEVYDGPNNSSKAFGPYCGNRVPPEFISTEDSLLVHFRTDNTISTKEFSAAYTMNEGSANMTNT